MKMKITQLHGTGDRTRENQSIPALLQDNSVPRMHLHPRQPDSGSSHISLRQARKGKRKTNTAKEEDWPVRKCDLVNNYLKQFTTFTNSIDFEKL
jgi:hypothetical protein